MKALLTIILIVIIQLSYCQDKSTLNTIQTNEAGNDGFSIYSRKKDLVKKKAPWFVQRFTMTGGYFAPQNNTKIEANGSSGAAGSRINLEDDLGFTKTTQSVFGNLQWRISRRSRLDLDGLLVNRSAVHTLQKDISFGDSTYKANTTVKAFFNAGTWRLSYGFALLAKPSYGIGLRIGAHVLVNDIGIKVYTGNAGYSRGHDFNFTKPLPDAGLWAGFELTKDFALNLEADYLDASVSNTLDGRIFSYNAALTWRISQPLQIAVGYKGLYFDINRQNSNFNGDFTWNTYGPQITATLAFPTKAWKTNTDEAFAIAPFHRKKNLVKKKAPWFVQRFTMTGGYFAPQNNTVVQVNGVNGAAGTRINFENDLGFIKTTQGVFGNLQWRISRRSRLDLDGLLVNRSAVHTLQKNLTFVDSTYKANTTVKAFFNAGTWRLSYGFALLAKRRYEIGLRIGAHVLVNDIGIKPYQGNAGYVRGHDFNFTSPLPDAGLWAGFEFTKHFALNLNADYLDASVSNTLDGRIFSYNAAFTWRVFRPLQIGVGYKGLYFDINRQNSDFNGDFKWNTHGPAVTAALAFSARAWKARMDETAYGGLWASSNKTKEAAKKTAPWFVQRFTMTGGYFAPQNNTKIEANGSSGAAGSRINLEDDLGFTKTTQSVFGNLQWRISRRSRLDLDGLLVNRSAVHTLQKDISFGDSTYKANTTVKAFFNAGTWRLSYGFALLAKPSYEIGFRIGAHVLVNDIGIKVYTGNAGYSRSHDFNFTKPLPDAGLWAGFELTKDFALNLEADYLDASVSNTLDGRIFSYNAALTWRISQPLQIAVGYKGLYFDINRQNSNFNGDFTWNTYGPQITATLAFPTKAWKTK